MRMLKMMYCDCTEFYEIYPHETVHCETQDGRMRCELCGRLKGNSEY